MVLSRDDVDLMSDESASSDIWLHAHSQHLVLIICCCLLSLNSLRHIACFTAASLVERTSLHKNYRTLNLKINICDDVGNAMLAAFSLHGKPFLNVLRGYVVDVGYDVCDGENGNEKCGNEKR